MAADARILADLDRLTLEELREYRRLEAKVRGLPDAIEFQPAKTPDAPDQVAADPDFKTDNSEGE